MEGITKEEEIKALKLKIKRLERNILFLKKLLVNKLK